VTKRATNPKDDPIYAAIQAHKEAFQNCSKLSDELERKEHAAEKKIGPRPSEGVTWRDYHVFPLELKIRRDQFIRWHRANPKFHQNTPKLIRAEYRDAVKRSHAQCRKASAWDRRAGVAALRKETDAALQREMKIGTRLGQTKPATPSGAAAVLRYIEVESRDTDMSGWYRETLMTTAKALQGMEKRP
jgi:hypothetical protein